MGVCAFFCLSGHVRSGRGCYTSVCVSECLECVCACLCLSVHDRNGRDRNTCV